MILPTFSVICAILVANVHHHIVPVPHVSILVLACPCCARCFYRDKHLPSCVGVWDLVVAAYSNTL